jgi:hypothetical protein
MKKYSLLVSAVILISILLSSCGLFVSAEAPSPTPSTDMISTAIVQTLAAQSTQIALTQPTGTQIPTDTTSPIDTETPVFTDTPANTPVPLLTSAPNIPQSSACDAGSFVADVTIPDGTVLPANSSFIKTWRILNSGTCTWTTDYQLIFASGSLLTAPSAVNLPAAVTPGQTVDISVNMVAPSTTGTFEGFWLLQNDSGRTFGVGSKGTAPVSVLITVGSPIPALTLTPESDFFAVTHVGMSVNPSSATVNCPPGRKFTFTADIETNSSGDVTYFWEFSDGGKTSEKTLDFTEPGTITVSVAWKLGSEGVESSNPFHGWARIHIDTPNHQTFSKKNITLTCRI